MNEPRIQYTKTSDGVNIAYWALGEGAPLIMLDHILVSNIQYEWGEIPKAREMYSRLAGDATFVRFDFRNHGLSARGVTQLTLDDHVSDLEAVLERIGGGPYTLFATYEGCKVAVRFASKHPERVNGVIMFGASVAPIRQSSGVPGLTRLGQLIDVNWDLYCDLFAVVCVGLTDPEYTKQLGQLFRESMQPDDYRASSRALMNADVRDYLPGMKAPLLLLHRKNVWFDMEIAQSIAATAPDARIAIIEGELADPWCDPVAEAVTEFFLEVADRPEAESASGNGFRAVLFTDLVGHTEMMSRLGDERGRGVLREHERITRDVLKAHGGTEVKTMGDGFMASFGSVTKAVECAIALQRAFADREGEPLSVRVGLNAGEPIEEEGPDGRADLFGATVNLASRIAAKAEGEEILVSDNVRSLSAGKGFLFADRGEFVAKGFEEPVRVYEVGWREAE